MSEFFEVLEVIGLMLLALGAILLVSLLGYIQATWNMTPEEKEKYLEYIEKNGISGYSDDDGFP